VVQEADGASFGRQGGYDSADFSSCWWRGGGSSGSSSGWTGQPDAGGTAQLSGCRKLRTPASSPFWTASIAQMCPRAW
jgi:hypothetical protein